MNQNNHSSDFTHFVFPNRKEKSFILTICVFIILFTGIFIFLKTKQIDINKSDVTLIKIEGTDDIESSPFKFTISPDNKYLLYFKKGKIISPFGYDEHDYNVVVINLESGEKYILENPPGFFGGQLAFNLSKNCWSTNSLYCVVPVGIKDSFSSGSWQTKDHFEEYYSDDPKMNIIWLDGNLLAESQIGDDTVDSVGFLNNAPDLIIDFTKERPEIITQFFRKNDYRGSVPNRKIFDSLTQEKFTCSDCESSEVLEKVFDSSHHGSIFTSPNGRYEAIKVSEEFAPGLFTSPKFYIMDLIDGIKYYISDNVYNVVWSSDSANMFVYKCELGGQCGSSSEDAIYKIDVKRIFSHN